MQAVVVKQAELSSATDRVSSSDSPISAAAPRYSVALRKYIEVDTFVVVFGFTYENVGVASDADNATFAVFASSPAPRLHLLPAFPDRITPEPGRRAV
jgi:hypothetical protein